MQGRAHKRSGRGPRRRPGWGRLLSCSMKIKSVVRKLWNYITENGESRESLRYSSEPQHTEALNIIQSSDVSIGDHFSFSGVWSVHHGKYRGNNVVFKILRKHSALEISAVSLKQQSELTVLSNLRHDRILPLMGVILDLDEAIAGFVTEFMPRGSLYDVLHLDTTPPEHRLTTLSSKVCVLRDVADGMQFLHEKKIIHHDLKSPSVLLDERGRAKLCDFGMSHIFYPNISHTAAFVGSPAWSSPEFLNGKVSTADQSTDVYSFGVILWETLTNNIPWDGSGTDSFQNASRISRGASLPLVAIPSCVPSELSAMLRQCMANDPDGRPTFKDIKQRLSNVPPACVEVEGTYSPHVCDVSDKKFNTIRACDVIVSDLINSSVFSNVFRGKYRGTDVAIKMLRRDGAKRMTNDGIKYMEIEILSNLRHPRIVSLMGVILDLDHRYGAMAGLVTEFMSRGSLYDVLHLDSTPPEHRLSTLSSKVRVLRDVADGMRFLHMSNMIHRDLKSPNVLLDEDGRAKICDFGLSRILNPNVSYATAVGTPAWSSPESLVGETGEVGQSTDVYSFGVILWEMLTNKIPWNNASPSHIISRVSHGESLPLDSITSGAYASELVAMLEQCLSTHPDSRPTFKCIVQCLSNVLLVCIKNEGRVACPNEFICPITFEIMNDPVMCSDGHTYDRVSIERWLQHHDSSPLTNVSLMDKAPRPNIALKSLIGKFKMKHGWP